MRLGQVLVLFGLLSVGGGLGLFLLTEAFRFDEATFRTYRRVAGGLAGYGLPAFLYGLIVVVDRETQAREVGVAGVVLSALAVVAFFGTYPERWDVAVYPITVVGTLAAYGLGVMLCSFAAGGAVLARVEADGETERDAEEEFIWGDPPES